MQSRHLNMDRLLTGTFFAAPSNVMATQKRKWITLIMTTILARAVCTLVMDIYPVLSDQIPCVQLGAYTLMTAAFAVTSDVDRISAVSEAGSRQVPMLAGSFGQGSFQTNRIYLWDEARKNNIR